MSNANPNPNSNSNTVNLNIGGVALNGPVGNGVWIANTLTYPAGPLTGQRPANPAGFMPLTSLLPMPRTDPMPGFGRQLLAGRPSTGCMLLPDAVYPVDFDLTSVAMQFHLLTWRHSHPERARHFWQDVEITAPAGHEGETRLSFLHRAGRARFLRWWRVYCRRFFTGLAPHAVALPYLVTGRVRGRFVAHPTTLDTAATSLCEPGFGLIEALPAWAWIVGNCRRPVVRLTGGWLFSNAAEAATFMLFAPFTLDGA